MAVLALEFAAFFFALIFIMIGFSIKMKGKILPILTMIFTVSLIAYITPNYSTVQIESSTLPIDQIVLPFILFGIIFPLIVFLRFKNGRY